MDNTMVGTARCAVRSHPLVCLGSYVEEDLSSWICPWCHARNYRKTAGLDRCEECAAEIVTAFTGYENEIKVTQSQPAVGTPRCGVRGHRSAMTLPPYFDTSSLTNGQQTLDQTKP